MADDFKALIEEQRRTTRLLMSAEERAEMDAAIAEEQHKEKIKSDKRIEGGRKAWQTRQANKEISAGGAAAKEDAQEEAANEKKTQGLLGKIAGGITGMFGKMKEKIKGAGKGIMAMLKGTLVAGLLLAVVAFLESPYWEETKKIIVEDILPVLITFFEFIKDNWQAILGGIVAVKAALVAAKILAIFQKIKTAYTVLKTATMTNILTPLKNAALLGGQKAIALFTTMWTGIKSGYLALKTATITNVLTPLKNAALLGGQKAIALFTTMWSGIKAGYLALKTATITNVLTPLKNAALLGGQKAIALFTTMWTGIKAGFIALKAKTMTHVLTPLQNAAAGVGGKIWSFMKLIPPALVALKVFFMSTFLPAVTAFMVPLLPVIAVVAAISLALYALWSAFCDAKKVFEETGSIGEALKVGISKFMGTILGFIPSLILKLVGWVAGLFGFDDFKKKVQAIDPIQWISDTIKGLFDKIEGWFMKLLDIDFSGMIASLVPKAIRESKLGRWVGGLFGGGKDKPKETSSAVVPEKGRAQQAVEAFRFGPAGTDAEIREQQLQFDKLEAKAAKERARGQRFQVGGRRDRLDYTMSVADRRKEAERIKEAQLARAARREARETSVVNAPVNTVNNSQNNTSIDSTPMFHPNPMVSAVNAAY